MAVCGGVIVTKLSVFALRLSTKRRSNALLKEFDILIRKRKRGVGGRKTNINWSQGILCYQNTRGTIARVCLAHV